MQRRRFLEASFAGAGAVVAGCTRPVTGPSKLATADEQLDDDGAEQHLRFEVDGERLAVVTLDQMTRPATATDPFRLRLHVAHRSGDERYDDPTTIRRFRFDLRAPPASVQPPAEVYLAAPGGPSWPAMELRRTDDRWTRIEAVDMAAVGAGTLTLETLVRPLGIAVDEVGLRAEVALSSAGLLGRDYVLEASTRFAPVQRGAATSRSPSTPASASAPRSSSRR